MIRFTKVIVDNKLIYQGGSYNNLQIGYWRWSTSNKVVFIIF